MSLIYEMSEEQKKIWDEWVAERPPVIMELCKRFQPNRLYVHKVTGQKVIPASFFEDGTMSIDILKSFNADRLMVASKNVFDVNPDNLVEAEPVNDVPMMTFDEYKKLIDSEA